MLTHRKYSTSAYWPRHKSTMLNRNERLDVVYSVWHHNAPSTLAPEDRINLIFLHGSQLTKEVWNYYVKLSYQHWGEKLDKVICVDSVNSGDSAVLNHEKIGWYNGWDDLARDNCLVIHDVINRREMSGPLFAIGHSMGGCEVLFMANFEPELLAGIILIDPVWGSGSDFLESEGIRQYMGTLGYKVHRRARDKFENKQEYDDYISNKFVSARFHPEVKADVEKHSGEQRGENYYMKGSRALQAGAYLSSVGLRGAGQTIFKYTSVPALVVAGEIEDWNPPGSNELLAEELPNAELATVKGGGHLVCYEKPDETFKVIAPFIDKVTATVEKHKAVALGGRGEAIANAFGQYVGTLKEGGNPKL